MIETGEADESAWDHLQLPAITYVSIPRNQHQFLDNDVTRQYECRQILTRADFMEGTIFILTTKCRAPKSHRFVELDRLNIISIDINHNVRPDSSLILHAARDIIEEEGFGEMLQSVRDRINRIENLHRTWELTVSAPPRLISPQC